MLRHKQVSVTGASGAVDITPAHGFLEAVKVAYTNGQAGGDLTITDPQTGDTYLTRTNSNTDLAATPVRKQAVDAAGSAITGIYERIPVTSGFTVTSAQQASNTTVVVDIWWQE